MKDEGKKNERGMALVLTLMILVIITALVTEFSYGVFTTTSALHNWETSQRLSFVARSGVTLAVKAISDVQRLYNYTYPGRVDIPVENILEGFSGSVAITVEDEDARFNLNSLIGTSQAENPDAFRIFNKLLTNLTLSEYIADRVADWIDKNGNPRLRDSEEGAKNNFINSIDELLLIEGIDGETYKKLLPHVAAHDPDDLININININVNTASLPVIMSLNDNDRSLSERIIQERDRKPFESKGDFETRVVNAKSTNLLYKSSNFRITVVAEENRIKRIIECVVSVSGGGLATVRYWKEM